MRTTLLKQFFYCFLFVPSVPFFQLQAQVDFSEIEGIISNYYGEWTDSSYPGLITNRIPNTALMGNGDVGVASGGDASTKTFYISKGDFWTFNGSPVAIGGISIRENITNEDNVDPQKTSLALNATATSSASHPSFPANRMINGNWTLGYEGWVSDVNTNASTNPFWAELDLGASKIFNRIVLRHDAAARPQETANVTKDFKVLIRNSADQAWQNVLIENGNALAISDLMLKDKVSARYVRLEITKGTQETTDDSRNNPRARVGQFELYLNNDLLAGITPNSGVYDLSTTKKIARYVIQLKSRQEVKIEYSDNAENWILAGIHTNDDYVDWTIPSFSARYVRITPKNAADIEFVSLFTEPSLNLNEISIPSNSSLYEIQDILNAEVRTEFKSGDANLNMRTFMVATDNVLVTELTSKSEKTIELAVTLWAKADRTNFPFTSEVKTGHVTVTRSTPNNQKSNPASHTSKAAISSKIIGANFTTHLNAGKGSADMIFSIEPNQTVYIVSAIGGGGQTYDYQNKLLTKEPIEEANEILSAVSNNVAVDNLLTKHKNWWKEYWSTSYIKLDVSDAKMNTLMKYYYAAQYALACSIREGKVAPGLYSLWHTTDEPLWNSDYHLNYNFISTFYGVNTSNRVWQSLPAIEAIKQYIPQGIKNAGSVSELRKVKLDFVNAKIAKGDIDATKGIPDAVLYPVGISPWGTMLDGGYHNEALNAAFSAYPMIEYYNYTQDESFLEEVMYNYLRLCVNFYDAWLENEDGKYVLYAGYNEGSWAINPAVELSVLKSALQNLIKASITLGLDEDKRPHWEDILSHLAPQPTATYQNKKVYTLAEQEWRNNSWQAMTNPIPGDGNIIPMESVIPGEQLGYYSSKEELEIAKNTIDVFSGRGAWSQINNFPKIYPVAVNTRYPVETIIDRFVSTINSQMKNNLMIEDNVHGIEKAGAIEAINNMMLLSDQGVITVFPGWVKNKDAKFVNLREKGAFVISSEYDSNSQEVSFIELLSEAGKPATLAVPWTQGIRITDSEGNIINVKKGSAPNHPETATVTFNTQVGMKYRIVKFEGYDNIQSIQLSKVNIYPSPVARGSNVIIETDFFGNDTSLEIYTISGQLLKTIPVDNPVISVNAGDTPGIYLFVIKAENKDKEIRKVVVN